MLDWFKHRSTVARKARELYGKVVTAARNPGFYGPGRVADTPEGRFDMIALHLFLAAERAKTVEPGGQAIAQGAIEAFVMDMDDCMREMGVGDLTVPKRVKRAAAVFYERSGQIRELLANVPLSASPDTLAAWIKGTLLRENSDAAFLPALASYIRASHDMLAQLSNDDIAAGRWEFANLPTHAGISP